MSDLVRTQIFGFLTHRLDTLCCDTPVRLLVSLMPYEPVHQKTKNLGPTRSDINRSVHSQKQARSLKIWIKKIDELYCPCSENKDADQLCSYCTASLICVFVFACADCWFSCAVAHIMNTAL